MQFLLKLKLHERTVCVQNNERKRDEMGKKQIRALRQLILREAQRPQFSKSYPVRRISRVSSKNRGSKNFQL